MQQQIEAARRAARTHAFRETWRFEKPVAFCGAVSCALCVIVVGAYAELGLLIPSQRPGDITGWHFMLAALLIFGAAGCTIFDYDRLAMVVYAVVSAGAAYAAATSFTALRDIPTGRRVTGAIR